ncbi:MAG: hypothetical protein ACI9XK_001231 [Granulosicoccus sp.]
MGLFDDKILTRYFPDYDVVQQLTTIGRNWNEASDRMLAAVFVEDRPKTLGGLLEISGYVEIHLQEWLPNDMQS